MYEVEPYIMANDIYDVTFKTPFRAVLCGPSGCGKTTFVRNMLMYQDQLYSVKPALTLYYYTHWQPAYDEMKNRGLVDQWHRGCPTTQSIIDIAEQYKGKGGIQVILDDLMFEAKNDLSLLYTRGSHHEEITVIFLSQNLFHDEKSFRTMKLNAQYLVLFKNPSNIRQIRQWFSQFDPKNANELLSIYETVTDYGYTYLLIDLHQETRSAVRIKSKIFPHNGVMDVFVKVGSYNGEQ